MAILFRSFYCMECGTQCAAQSDRPIVCQSCGYTYRQEDILRPDPPTVPSPLKGDPTLEDRLRASGQAEIVEGQVRLKVGDDTFIVSRNNVGRLKTAPPEPEAPTISICEQCRARGKTVQVHRVSLPKRKVKSHNAQGEEIDLDLPAVDSWIHTKSGVRGCGHEEQNAVPIAIPVSELTLEMRQDLGVE